MKTLKPEQLEKLKEFINHPDAFNPSKFLDWTLWEGKIQFKIETIGYNGGWKITRVDPMCQWEENRIKLISGTFKDLIWETAQALWEIESKENE